VAAAVTAGRRSGIGRSCALASAFGVFCGASAPDLKGTSEALGGRALAGLQGGLDSELGTSVAWGEESGITWRNEFLAKSPVSSGQVVDSSDSCSGRDVQR
jgi:hypothetical protein